MDQIRQAFNTNLKHVGKVSSTELNDMANLISEAASGKMAERVGKGCDMGTNALVAFHKTEVMLYRMVLLKETGDCHVHNISSAAVKLRKLLNQNFSHQSQNLPAMK